MQASNLAKRRIQGPPRWQSDVASPQGDHVQNHIEELNLTQCVPGERLKDELTVEALVRPFVEMRRCQVARGDLFLAEYAVRAFRGVLTPHCSEKLRAF